MPNLKDLRTRKKAVQSTKKITLAMKLIAAAKLNKLHLQISTIRPYINLMSEMIDIVLDSLTPEDLLNSFLRKKDRDQKHLIIVATSNRGLCGGFNSSIVRYVQHMIKQDIKSQKETILVCIGRKGFEQLKREYYQKIITVFEAYDKPLFANAEKIYNYVNELYEKHEFDSCTLVYNKFISALIQKVTAQRLIPYEEPEEFSDSKKLLVEQKITQFSPYEYEPQPREVLTRLLPEFLKTQIFAALIENTTSEQGARMAAMDGATRNAENMLTELDLQYNRTRQSIITKELIEIISGAEAL